MLWIVHSGLAAIMDTLEATGAARTAGAARRVVRRS
jgi:hypothetical protein